MTVVQCNAGEPDRAKSLLNRGPRPAPGRRCAPTTVEAECRHLRSLQLQVGRSVSLFDCGSTLSPSHRPELVIRLPLTRSGRQHKAGCPSWSCLRCSDPTQNLATAFANKRPRSSSCNPCMGSISGNHEAEIGRWRAPRRRDFCAAYACSEAAVTAARKLLRDGCRNDRCREREVSVQALQFAARPVPISRTLRVNLYHEQRAAFTVDGAIPQLSRVDALIDETKGPPQAGS